MFFTKGLSLKKIFFLFLFLFPILPLFSKEKLVVEYKKYERIDLGQIGIEGEVQSPGDLSVRDRARRKSKIELFNKDNFLDLIEIDFQSIR
jgi:hypothetical protein